MDLRLSDEDRVGGRTSRTKAKSRPAKQRGGGWFKSKPKSRIEPTVGQSVGVFVDDELSGSAPLAPARKGKAAPVKGKAKPVRKVKAKKRFTIAGFFFKIFYWLIVLGVWAGIAGAAVVAYFYVQLPASNTWAIPDRPANIQILAADGRLISNRGQMGGEAVALRDLPHFVPEAFIAIEDRRFYEHFGVDVIGLASVAMESLRAGGVTRGASTISQQLAKNLFLTPAQTLERKVQEALLAVWLEQNYSKEQILELYLNRVFFGHGASGIEAAAQTYFGKSAKNLSLGEVAILAGSLQAPSKLNPKGDPALVQARQTLVLQAMAREGFITPAEAKAATIDPSVKVRTVVAGAEYYVADWVETLMKAYLGEVKEDVIVSTTINWDLQKQAEFIVKEAVANEGPKRGFTQGALVAMDADGTVRAMVGGTDYALSQYNRAVTARRQPGSAFKPFVYLAAMEKGYNPDTIAEDAPFTYQGWSPENASHKYNGNVTLRTGLAYSLNTIAARLAIDVTPQVVVDTAMRMGISSPMEAVPSIALGTSEVSLLELTAAYAPFANGGQGVIANVITKITTASGKVLYEATPGGPGQVIDPFIVGEMNDMLSTAVEIGTGKGANLPGWQIGGKTGTSQQAKDALFVGFSAKMVTGVWLGNDDNAGTTLSGGNVPAQIWSEFMQKAHDGIAPVDLPTGGAPIIASTAVDATGQTYALDANGQPLVDATGRLVMLDANGQPFTVDETGQALPVQGLGAPPPQPVAETQPTAQQSPEAQDSLVDLIGDLFQ